MKHCCSRILITTLVIYTSINCSSEQNKPHNKAIHPQAESTLIMVPTSVGELFDKITILEVKIQRISDPQKLEHVLYEWYQLTDVLKQNITMTPELEQLKLELFHSNGKQWDVENGKRSKEKEKDFGPEFIELARNIYFMNDHRCTLKQKINELTGSLIVEVKQLPEY